MNKFDKYGGKVSFTVNNELLEFKRIKTERLQMVINYAKDEDTVLINIVDFFVEEIKKNYPEDSEEGVLAFAQGNAMGLFEEFQIAYGLVTREDLKEAKDKAKEEVRVKTEKKKDGDTNEKTE